jgi:hypothetical protein
MFLTGVHAKPKSFATEKKNKKKNITKQNRKRENEKSPTTSSKLYYIGTTHLEYYL